MIEYVQVCIAGLLLDGFSIVRDIQEDKEKCHIPLGGGGSALGGTVVQYPVLNCRSSIAMSPVKSVPRTPSMIT